ncbi:ATP synthase F0 subunit C [Coprothermobacter proteolyticus]|jgi:F-type H+-transporting ATPase subunit c|uniref:ATP synthase subunit c n=1 Tax=Coprothermobacter proteolyticus (strain ATCC 35245 / DSM 5265 / OCM 4 / BT) TaxID=309798 RepID=B5Y827_COPPD|nr:ATP synthase F0 subunit C [Coprothermobacter proteolyticus]MBK6585788.1 ATP synthase F0 subunit C [Coprothermobacter sp.]ACI17913.1 ATP synthase subunit C [Coprothermobacter proteolyticus DSM 5265]MBP8983845.1 ATP synthase F0 subunit C [Coprothermobacter sp.]NLT83329.1 ATP synthase F0 subunit C [Coprothermobacter proteolyticus]HAR40281.1 ATP synthase F0 subunit C [Coprothermobacter sp.]
MSNVVAAILSAGWPLGIAAGLAALGMGIAAGKAFEAISRQPDASGDIRSLTLIAFAFIESLVIYVLAVAFLMLFVRPGV